MNQHAMQKVNLVPMEYHRLERHSVIELQEKIDGLGFALERIIHHDGYGIAWLRKIA